MFFSTMKELSNNPYVSRAGLKLDQAYKKFKLDFSGQHVLDVGSSAGGFTDFALHHGARKVIAIELGSDQMSSKLRLDKRVELHEKTDILDVKAYQSIEEGLKLSFIPDIVLVDLSFVSLRKILPKLKNLVSSKSRLVVMVKPQFEASRKQKNKGIIKNENIRRQILKDFELWVKDYYVLLDKTDSKVAGLKGNIERFYLLAKA